VVYWTLLSTLVKDTRMCSYQPKEISKLPNSTQVQYLINSTDLTYISKSNGYKSNSLFPILFTRPIREFGPKRDEVTGKWRRLHNEEPNDMHSSPNTIQVIRLGRIRWAGHVACMGER
jgi:hypothetical protein